MAFDATKIVLRAAGVAILVVWSAGICMAPAVVAWLPGTVVAREFREGDLRGFDARFAAVFPPVVAAAEPQPTAEAPRELPLGPGGIPARTVATEIVAPEPPSEAADVALKPLLDKVESIKAARAEAAKAEIARSGAASAPRTRKEARRRPSSSRTQSWPCTGKDGICAWREPAEEPAAAPQGGPPPDPRYYYPSRVDPYAFPLLPPGVPQPGQAPRS